MAKVTIAVVLSMLAAILTAPAGSANPAPSCVNPDGSACAADPPGCVDPATSLPCSSQLQDVNAAIRRELQQILPGLLGGR